MRYAKKAFIGVFVIILALLGGVSYWIFVLSPYDLPKGPLVFERLKPPSSSTLYDGQAKAIYYYGRNDPVSFYRPLNQIDKKLQDWVVMLEDAKFFSHRGFDVDEINNSFWKNIKAGKIKRGGSGITQQLAKNLFLDQQRSYLRKFFEVPWTLKLESSLSKRQLLELYLNSIEWGPGIAGAEAASRYYFGKASTNLTPGEAMYLALVIPSPGRFDLLRNPSAAKSLETKRRWFVNRLVSEKRIPASEKQNYLSMSFGIREIDDTSRDFPAPISKGFRAPEWAEFLKPFAKGKDSRVPIVKVIQISGLEPSSWILPDDENTEMIVAHTWCARSDHGLSGYWTFDQPLAPSFEFLEFIQIQSHELNPCEDIDIKEVLSK
jgi:monofunctional biosynthetic peptidoglycan transglycosylase